MRRDIQAEAESFPIAGSFTIARGSRTVAEIVTCTIRQGERAGRGECVPYARYGETVDSVLAAIGAMADAISQGMDRRGLMLAMPAGAARNAIDCALWDLECKLGERNAASEAGAENPRPLVTAVTISLGEPGDMAEQARAHAKRPLLKVKVGTGDDVERIRAVAEAAPNSRIILDANEGWGQDNIRRHMLAAARAGIALVEQPLPAGQDAVLGETPHPVPICADESVHGPDDLQDLLGLYDAVNIKLDKTGGLTAALELKRRAREFGFGVMVGCMVGSSLAMAPAVLLAQDADFVDLDGPLLLARDREPSLDYEGSMVSPPSPDLWG